MTEKTPFVNWLDAVVPTLFPSDAQLAAAAGVNRSTVLRWRRGHTPKAPQLLRLADAAGCRPETLLRIAGHTGSPDKAAR